MDEPSPPASLSDLFYRLDEARLNEDASEACDALVSILSMLPDSWATDLVAATNDNRDAIANLFDEDRGLSRLVRFLLRELLQFVSSPGDVLEPGSLLNISSLLCTLARPYVDTFAESHRTTIRGQLRGAIDQAVSEAVKRLDTQVRVLGEMIFRLVQEPSLIRHSGRIVLIELPLGNSIPTKLLHYFFEKHDFNVHLVRVALSRNEKASMGVTRKHLLEDQLTTLDNSDLVLLCDEWITGSNFRAMIDHIEKIVRAADARFLPIGMLAAESDRYQENNSAIRKHKKIVARSGFGETHSARFRVRFPKIQSPLIWRDYFFWGDNDRLAGYRKMQILGSTVSSLKATLTQMLNDDRLLARGHIFFLMAVAR